MSTLTSSGVALASRLGQDAIKTLLPPMIGEPVSPLAAIHLLVDLLESLERSCDELLASRYAPDPDLDGRDPDTVLLRTAGMRDFIDHLEAQELALVAKLTRARLWAELVGNSDERLARFANLFHAGSTALSELGPRLADPIEDLFATGGQQLAFLMARGIISDVRATADGSVPIQIHPHYLVCGIAPVGDIAAMVTSTLNALDAHYGLYEADAELDEDGDGAGLSLASLAQAMQVAGAAGEAESAAAGADRQSEAVAEAPSLDAGLPEHEAEGLPDQSFAAAELLPAPAETEAGAAVAALASLDACHADEASLALETGVASDTVDAAAAAAIELETEANAREGEVSAGDTAEIVEAEVALGDAIFGTGETTVRPAEDAPAEGLGVDAAFPDSAAATLKVPELVLEASETGQDDDGPHVIEPSVRQVVSEADDSVLDLMPAEPVETNDVTALEPDDAPENTAETDEAVLELGLTEPSSRSTDPVSAEAAVPEPAVSAVAPAELAGEPAEAAGDAPSSVVHELDGPNLPHPNPSPEGEGLEVDLSKPLPFRGGVGEVVPDAAAEPEFPLLADGAAAVGAVGDSITVEATAPADESSPVPADEPSVEDADASEMDSILELSADNDDAVLDLDGLDTARASLPEDSLAQRLAALAL